MSELVTALREGCLYHDGPPGCSSGGVDEAATDKLMTEAADEIERLQAIVERVDAIYSDWYDGRFSDGDAMSAIAGAVPTRERET